MVITRQIQALYRVEIQTVEAFDFANLDAHPNSLLSCMMFSPLPQKALVQQITPKHRSTLNKFQTPPAPHSYRPNPFVEPLTFKSFGGPQFID